MKFITRTATLLAAAGFLAPAALAQKSDIKRALPPSTIFFMSMPDIDASIEEFQSTPLAKIWREKEVQDFFAEAMKMAHGKIQQGMEKMKEAVAQGQSPLSAEEILGLRIHGASFAMTGLKIEVPEAGQPRPDVGIMLHLDFGSSAPSWKKAIDFGLQMIEGQAQGMLVKNESKVGDFQAVELAPQMDEVKNSFNWCWMGNSLLIGTRASEFKAALATLGGDKQELTASATYIGAAKQLTTKGAEMEAYLNMGQLMDTGMEILELAAKANRRRFPKEFDVKGVGRALEALGLRSIQAMGYSTHYENGKSITESYTLSPEPTRRGLMAGGSGSLSTAFLKWVPKDSTGFNATKFDCSALYESVMGAVKAYNPEIASEAMQHLEGVEAQLGFKIRDDLFGALGDEVIWWSMPMASLTQAPDVSVLVKMRDDSKFLKVAKALVGLSEGMVEIDDVERGGHKMHILKINADPTGGGGMNPFASLIVPTFAFKNGYMVLGLSANNVKKLLERMDREDDPKGDIRANAELAVALEKLPKGTLSSLSFTDWKSSLEGYYQLLTTALAFLPVNNSEIPIDLSLLPEAATLTKHMFGAISWTTTDANGFRSYSVSPFGPELTVTALAIGMGAATFAGVSRAEQMVAPRGARNLPPPKKVSPQPAQEDPQTRKKDK